MHHFLHRSRYIHRSDTLHDVKSRNLRLSVIPSRPKRDQDVPKKTSLNRLETEAFKTESTSMTETCLNSITIEWNWFWKFRITSTIESTLFTFTTALRYASPDKSFTTPYLSVALSSLSAPDRKYWTTQYRPSVNTCSITIHISSAGFTPLWFNDVYTYLKYFIVI